MIKTKITFLVIVMTLVTNCTAQLPDTTNTTYTSTPQALYTLTLDIKPSETATSAPTLTEVPTLTPTSTWTPLPTLSAQEAQVKIKELLETNSGCELPCWWGITPNKTPWPETLHFLTPLIANIGQGGSENFSKDGKRHSVTSYSVYYEIAGVSELGHIDFDVQDDVVIWIGVFSPSTQFKYQLYQLLALLGPPSQIFISAKQRTPNPILPPTVLVLDYSDIGVWASYGFIPSESGENLVICPKPFVENTSMYDNVGGRLELFNPEVENDRALSIEEYADMVSGFTAKKLEDVTNMTIETFSNTFIDPNPEVCLETPANLWP